MSVSVDILVWCTRDIPEWSGLFGLTRVVKLGSGKFLAQLCSWTDTVCRVELSLLGQQGAVGQRARQQKTGREKKNVQEDRVLWRRRVWHQSSRGKRKRREDPAEQRRMC